MSRLFFLLLLISDMGFAYRPYQHPYPGQGATMIRCDVPRGYQHAFSYVIILPARNFQPYGQDLSQTATVTVFRNRYEPILQRAPARLVANYGWTQRYEVRSSVFGLYFDYNVRRRAVAVYHRLSAPQSFNPYMPPFQQRGFRWGEPINGIRPEISHHCVPQFAPQSPRFYQFQR